MLKRKQQSGEQASILLVEPDAFLADIYEKNLLLEDFKVTKAPSAERALALLKTKKFDLALLAAILPKMNGFELLETLKNNQESAPMPVLMLSKLGTKEDVDRSRSLGAAGYIIKTHFQPSEIVDKIKKILFQRSR
jgi:DNA-binding response OmpR family regulator